MLQGGLILGREDVYFGYEFAIQGGTLPSDVIAYYVDLPSRPDVLTGSLGFYPGLDATLEQNAERVKRPLPMPVLAIGGAASHGEHVGQAMAPLADDVQSVVIPGVGHWVAEGAPDEMLALLGILPGAVSYDVRAGRGHRELGNAHDVCTSRLVAATGSASRPIAATDWRVALRGLHRAFHHRLQGSSRCPHPRERVWELRAGESACQQHGR